MGKDGTLLKVTEAPGMEGTTQSYKRFMQKVQALHAEGTGASCRRYRRFMRTRSMRQVDALDGR